MPQFYPLRALAVNNNSRYYDFTVADGICPTKANEFILLNKRNTPTLRTSPIFRGTEDSSFFEGDIVLSNKEIYCIKFVNEFIAVNSLYKKKLDELENPKVVGTAVLASSEYYSNPNKITFKHKDYIFGLASFGGAVGDKIVINTDGWQRVDPSEICMFAAVVEGYGKVYLNEIIEGKQVLMNKGRVYLK